MFRGTHKEPFQGMPATGKKVVLTGLALWRFQDGKDRPSAGTRWTPWACCSSSGLYWPPLITASFVQGRPSRLAGGAARASPTAETQEASFAMKGYHHHLVVESRCRTAVLPLLIAGADQDAHRDGEDALQYTFRALLAVCSGPSTCVSPAPGIGLRAPWTMGGSFRDGVDAANSATLRFNRRNRGVCYGVMRSRTESLKSGTYSREKSLDSVPNHIECHGGSPQNPPHTGTLVLRRATAESLGQREQGTTPYEHERRRFWYCIQRVDVVLRPEPQRSSREAEAEGAIK